MAIFNEKNLRRLINEKIEQVENKCIKRFAELENRIANNEMETRKLETRMRWLEKHMYRIKSLPMFQDSKTFEGL